MIKDRLFARLGQVAEMTRGSNSVLGSTFATDVGNNFSTRSCQGLEILFFF